jgi:hypothetical protein
VETFGEVPLILLTFSLQSAKWGYARKRQTFTAERAPVCICESMIVVKTTRALRVMKLQSRQSRLARQRRGP